MVEEVKVVLDLDATQVVVEAVEESSTDSLLSELVNMLWLLVLVDYGEIMVETQVHLDLLLLVVVLVVQH